MTKWHLIYLQRPKEPNQLRLYQVRAKSKKAARLIMRQQGILPVYRIVSHEEQSFWKTLAGIIFPRFGVVKNVEGEVNVVTSIKYFFLPILCFPGRHILSRFGPDGEICKRCKRTFPDLGGTE